MVAVMAHTQETGETQVYFPHCSFADTNKNEKCLQPLKELKENESGTNLGRQSP